MRAILRHSICAGGPGRSCANPGDALETTFSSPGGLRNPWAMPHIPARLHNISSCKSLEYDERSAIDPRHRRRSIMVRPLDLGIFLPNAKGGAIMATGSPPQYFP